MGVARLRGQPILYDMIFKRQSGRCIWCGVDLRSPEVRETLDHVAPKHYGDDLPDGSNWALTCESCNSGKADTLAWAACAEAHDFLSRNSFGRPDRIGLPQRWCVFARVKKCDECGESPKKRDLWVYRKIPTGLPIPANCSATCPQCAVARGREILAVDWAPNEIGRASP
jgi:hypothetical protein